MFELEIWDLLILYFCFTGMICAITASGLDTLQENVKMQLSVITVAFQGNIQCLSCFMLTSCLVQSFCQLLVLHGGVLDLACWYIYGIYHHTHLQHQVHVSLKYLVLKSICYKLKLFWDLAK